MAVSAPASPPASGALLTDLYHEHAGPLYGYARYLTTSVHDAEDLVQITFMQAYRTLERGKEIEHPRAWLMTTMRRRAFNLARDRHEVATDTISETALTDVSTSAAVNEQVAAVRVALEQLPESQRHAFVLRHWSGLSASEIAEVLQTSEPSVQSLLSRARATLRSDRKLARATQAVTSAVFIPTARMRHNLSELIPGFAGGDGTATTTTAAVATSIGAGKAAFALKGALAVVAATGVLAVGHERHVDSRVLQAAGIDQPHHQRHSGSGIDDHGGRRADSHGRHGGGGQAEAGDDRGGTRKSGKTPGNDGGGGSESGSHGRGGGGDGGGGSGHGSDD
jgi:RNA polymerase sigma-70 factor (ECF subfamily)